VNAWPLPSGAELVSRIIHREPGFLVIDKPPGLVSAGPPRQIHGEPAPRQSVESLLVAALGRQVWAVHQLDRLTTGLNVFALKSSMVAPLSERLKTPGAKRYLAIVHGHPRAPQRIEVPLGTAVHPRTGKTHPAIATSDISISKTIASTRSATPRDQTTSRYALTHLLRAIPTPELTPEGDPAPAFSWVEVALETGRQHQVRLHLAHLGHPLVGEPLHREPPCELHPRQALHAWRLTLPATPTMAALDLVAPIPGDLIALAIRLGLPPEP
jgi:23S rRNA-/tRNA-specific pseudouridylate synthase